MSHSASISSLGHTDGAHVEDVNGLVRGRYLLARWEPNAVSDFLNVERNKVELVTAQDGWWSEQVNPTSFPHCHQYGARLACSALTLHVDSFKSSILFTNILTFLLKF